MNDIFVKFSERIAGENKKPMLLGRLIVDDSCDDFINRGSFSDLLNRDLRHTTISLWFIWTSCSFIYYGIVLMTTELLEKSGHNICAIDNSNPLITCSAQCAPLDYGNLLWTTLAEFPGIMITIALIEKVGRKRTLTFQFLLLTLCLCSLFHCTNNRTLLTIILFIIRGVASGVFQAAYVYTPEVYPTSLRSIGVGSCSGMARIGAMLTPQVAQVMLMAHRWHAISIYASVSVIAAILAYFLPLETKGRELPETRRSYT